MLIGSFCQVILVYSYSATHISTHLHTNLSTAPKCAFSSLLSLTIWQLSLAASPGSAAGLLLSSCAVSCLQWWGSPGWDHHSTTTNMLAAGWDCMEVLWSAMLSLPEGMPCSPRGMLKPAVPCSHLGSLATLPSLATPDTPRPAIFLSRATLAFLQYNFLYALGCAPAAAPHSVGDACYPSTASRWGNKTPIEGMLELKALVKGNSNPLKHVVLCSGCLGRRCKKQNK